MLHDVVIVGAGPVGATLALSLRDADLDLVVLDARAQGESGRGDRSLALSHGARLIFERLGVWTPLASAAGAVSPITEIDISQAGGFGVTRLVAAEHGLPALGYVVSYRALQAALDAALANAGIAVRFATAARSVGGTPAYAAVIAEGDAEPLTARLAVVADGAATRVAGIARERRDYGQVAVIARLRLVRAHGGVAYERFTSGGPIALLPLAAEYGLVWTQTPEEAKRTLALSDRDFLATLAERFGARVPGFAGVAERRAFPLALEYAHPIVTTRAAVVGNAAQALHPIAGQGFNLGLRDAHELAAAIIDCERDAIGERAMLDAYARARLPDRIAGVAFTHGLVHLFGNDLSLLRWPRGLALTMLDAISPLKRAFTRSMLFGIR